MVDPVEYIWSLFEETPRPSHLPPCLFPNEYPFELGFKYYPQPVVPVPSGPLSSYHDHDHDPLSSYHDHDRIPVPGEPGAPPVWCSDFPPDQPDVPLPSAGAPLPSSTVAPLLPINWCPRSHILTFFPCFNRLPFPIAACHELHIAIKDLSWQIAASSSV